MTVVLEFSSSKKETTRKPILQIFHGKFRLPPPKIEVSKSNSIILPLSPIPSSKVVVFDLDETLGSFGDLFLLWSGIRHFYPEFNQLEALLDIYPEFLRNGIISILSFIHQKKKTRECEKLFIYTNNQCSPTWVSMLTNYFQTKMKIDNGNNFELFDKVIGAFKINNIPIEIHRTTHQKTYSDLIQCTMLPKNTEFCFIDDTEYAKMKHDKIYYIKPREYIHPLSKNEIIERLHLKLPDLGVEITPEYWYYWLSQSTSVEKNKESLIMINLEVSKKMMFHIREFFVLSSFQKYRNKSRKKMSDNKNTIFPRNTKKIRE